MLKVPQSWCTILWNQTQKSQVPTASFIATASLMTGRSFYTPMAPVCHCHTEMREASFWFLTDRCQALCLKQVKSKKCPQINFLCLPFLPPPPFTMLSTASICPSSLGMSLANEVASSRALHPICYRVTINQRCSAKEQESLTPCTRQDNTKMLLSFPLESC